MISKNPYFIAVLVAGFFMVYDTVLLVTGTGHVAIVSIALAATATLFGHNLTRAYDHRRKESE